MRLDNLLTQPWYNKNAVLQLNNQHTSTAPAIIKVTALNATLSWKYSMTLYCMWLCIHVYTTTQSLLISTLLSSACNIGAVSLASEEENRILHNGRIWFEEWTTLICFQTHVPLLLLPCFGDSLLSSSLDWSGYCCEETSPSTCWKIGPVRVPWSTHPPTPDTTPTKWSTPLHTLSPVYTY